MVVAVAIVDLTDEVKSMEEIVQKQIKQSFEVVKQQTSRLTFHDKLITDDMLLQLDNDVLKNVLHKDELKELADNNPDYSEKLSQLIAEIEVSDEPLRKNTSESEMFGTTDVPQLSDEDLQENQPSEENTDEVDDTTEEVVTTKETKTSKKSYLYGAIAVVIAVIGGGYLLF